MTFDRETGNNLCIRKMLSSKFTLWRKDSTDQIHTHAHKSMSQNYGSAMPNENVNEEKKLKLLLARIP